MVAVRRLVMVAVELFHVKHSDLRRPEPARTEPLQERRRQRQLVVLVLLQCLLVFVLLLRVAQLGATAVLAGRQSSLETTRRHQGQDLPIAVHGDRRVARQDVVARRRSQRLRHLEPTVVHGEQRAALPRVPVDEPPVRRDVRRPQVADLDRGRLGAHHTGDVHAELGVVRDDVSHRATRVSVERHRVRRRPTQIRVDGVHHDRARADLVALGGQDRTRPERCVVRARLGRRLAPVSERDVTRPLRSDDAEDATVGGDVERLVDLVRVRRQSEPCLRWRQRDRAATRRDERLDGVHHAEHSGGTGSC